MLRLDNGGLGHEPQSLAHLAKQVSSNGTRRLSLKPMVRDFSNGTRRLSVKPPVNGDLFETTPEENDRLDGLQEEDENDEFQEEIHITSGPIILAMPKSKTNKAKSRRLMFSFFSFNIFTAINRFVSIFKSA